MGGGYGLGGGWATFSSVEYINVQKCGLKNVCIKKGHGWRVVDTGWGEAGLLFLLHSNTKMYKNVV